MSAHRSAHHALHRPGSGIPRGRGQSKAEREDACRRERLARYVARMMNRYVVPDVPPFTRRELLLMVLGTLIIGAMLSLLILGTAPAPVTH